MRHTILAAATTALLLSACGSEQAAEDRAQTATMDVSEEAEIAVAEPDSAGESGELAEGAGDIPVSLPQIAYSYFYGFRVPAGDIAAAQEAHSELCEKQGPTVCRVLNMSQSGSEGDFGEGSLELEIAAPRARAFGSQLVAAIAERDGEQVSASIEGEDLSKQIVDTEARLRSRIVLRDRLMEVLATRKGSVQDLVAAERAVSEVNEEIDQAQSWLKEMKGRVAYSKINLNYRSGERAGGSFLQPIANAFANIGSIMGTVIAVIIMVIVGVLPFAAIGLLGWWAYRRYRARNPVAESPAPRPPATVKHEEEA